MWHIRAILVGMAGIFFFFVSAGRADSLQLKNGNFVQGKYLGGTDRAVQFETNGKVRIYDIDEILSISFAAASADGGIPSNAEGEKPGTRTESSVIEGHKTAGLRAGVADRQDSRKADSARILAKRNRINPALPEACRQSVHGAQANFVAAPERLASNSWASSTSSRVARSIRREYSAVQD